MAERLTRREREWLRHRQEILDVALVLFSENGFSSVTMQHITERSEFSIGTLYNLFASKEDLYQTLIRELTKEFHQSILRAIDSGDDEVEKLRNYVRVKGTVFRDNLAVIRLYYRETSGLGFDIKAGLDDEIRTQYAQFMNILAKIFEDGIRKKKFRKIADPHLLATAVDSFTNAVLLGCLEDPDRRPYPEDPDILLSILFKGLLES